MSGTQLSVSPYRRRLRRNKVGVTARLVVKSGLRETLRREKKIVKTIPVTDGCKDNASDKSQTSDLDVSPDLSISDSGDNQKTIACIIYSFIYLLIILKLYMTFNLYLSR
jgi:hypothetical protein